MHVLESWCVTYTCETSLDFRQIRTHDFDIEPYI